MSFKLSRNKVNFLASLVAKHLEQNDEVDYFEDIGDIRFKIFHLIMDEMRIFEQIEDTAKERIRAQKKNIPDGSREWEILFRKYAAEALEKMGRIWD